MKEQRKSSHQPYGNIADVLDSEMSFSDFFSKRQIDKVRDAVNLELAHEEKEGAST